MEALLKIQRDKARKLSKDFCVTALVPDAHYRRDIQEAIDAAIPTSFTAPLNGYKNVPRFSSRSGRAPAMGS